MDGRFQAAAECGPSSLAMQAAAAAGGPPSYDGQGRLIWCSFTTHLAQRWGAELSKGPSGPLESPNAERRSGGKRRRREGVVPMMRSKERESLSSRGGVEKGSRGRGDNDISTGRETPGDEVQGRYDGDGHSMDNMLAGGRGSSPTDSSSGNSSGAGSQEKGGQAKLQRSEAATQGAGDAAREGTLPCRGSPQTASPSNPQIAKDLKAAGRASPRLQKLTEAATSQKLSDTGRKDQVWADMLLQDLNDSAARADRRGADEAEPGPEAGAPPTPSFQFIKTAAETPFQRVSRFEKLEKSAKSGHSQGRYGEPAGGLGALKRGRAEASWSFGRLRNWSGGRSSERQSSNASCGAQRGPGEEGSHREPSSAREGDVHSRPVRAASPLGDNQSREAPSVRAGPAAAGLQPVDEQAPRDAGAASVGVPDLNSVPGTRGDTGDRGQQRVDLSSGQEPKACSMPEKDSAAVQGAHASSQPPTMAAAEAKRPLDGPCSSGHPTEGPPAPRAVGEAGPSPLSARAAWNSGCLFGAGQPLPFTRSPPEPPRRRPGVPAPKKRMRPSNPLPFPWLPSPAAPQAGAAEGLFWQRAVENPAAWHQQAQDGPSGEERGAAPAPQGAGEGGSAPSFPGFAPPPFVRKGHAGESEVFPGDSFFGAGHTPRPKAASPSGGAAGAPAGTGTGLGHAGVEQQGGTGPTPGSGSRLPGAPGAGPSGRGTPGPGGVAAGAQPPSGSALSGKRRCHSEDVLLQYVLEGCGRSVEELHQGQWHVNEAFVARISDLFATKREQEEGERLQPGGAPGGAPEKSNGTKAREAGEGRVAGAQAEGGRKEAPQEKGQSPEGDQPKSAPGQQAQRPSAAEPGAPGSSGGGGAYPLFGSDREASRGKGKGKYSEGSGRSGRSGQSGRSGRSGGSSFEQGLGQWDKMSDSVRIATQQLLELQRWDGLTCKTAVYWTVWLLRRTRSLQAAKVPRALSLLLFTSLHCALPRVLASLHKPVFQRDEVQVGAAAKLVDAIQHSRRLFSVMRWGMLQEQLAKCAAALGHAGATSQGGLFPDSPAKEGGEPSGGGERGGTEVGEGAKAGPSHGVSSDNAPRRFSPAFVGRAASLFDLSSGRAHTPEPAPQQPQAQPGSSSQPQPAQPAPGAPAPAPAPASQWTSQGVPQDLNTEDGGTAGGPSGGPSVPGQASQKQPAGDAGSTPSLSFPTFKQNPPTQPGAPPAHHGGTAGQQAGAQRLKRPFPFCFRSGGDFGDAPTGLAGAGSPLGVPGGAGAGIAGGRMQGARGAGNVGAGLQGLGGAGPAPSPGAYEAAEADAMSRLSQMFSPYSAAPKRPQHRRAPPPHMQGGAPAAPFPFASPGGAPPSAGGAGPGLGGAERGAAPAAGFQFGANRWAAGVPPPSAAPGGAGPSGLRSEGFPAFPPRGGAQASQMDAHAQGVAGRQQQQQQQQQQAGGEDGGVPQAPMGFCGAAMLRPGSRGGQARAFGAGGAAGAPMVGRQAGEGGPAVDGSTWSRLMGSFGPYGGGRPKKPSAPSWAPKDFRSQVPLGSS